MLAHRDPNTIHLGGEITKMNEHIAGVAITPGMIIELYDDSNKMKWRPHASATEISTGFVALEKSIHNKTVDDAYAIGELVYAARFHPGATFWGLVPSGQNVSAGEFGQSNGNGMVKVATATTSDANLAAYQFEEALGLITATTRCRTRVR